MIYPFNLVIYSSREFFGHMKQYSILITSRVKEGNSFLQDSRKTVFFLLCLVQKNEIAQWLTSTQGYLLSIKIIINMKRRVPTCLYQGILSTSFFWGRVRSGRNSALSLRKSWENLFLSLTRELMKVAWCFICQKNPVSCRLHG